MSYWKFQLIHQHLRPFDHSKIDETTPLPKVFQTADEWSDYIQAVSAEIFVPGSHLAGFFIRWLWHIKEAKYGAVGVELPPPKSSTQGRRGRRGGRGRGAAKVAGKKPATEDKPIALNSTQSVVAALANMLPKATYHVFVDNLFSSSDLFRCLRKHGHGATGTARPNCGIDKEIQQDKKANGRAKTSYESNQVKVIPTPDN
ncbi:hypothetical protein BFJ63_vAg18011 [Fusarium oxysporum f. sp. narcissi]|uniref:PiggyBac transposable element-derived protein domain-containing protein n=1 Tax=Fusarium oxysporum f. sp. narcissi TaxID=451672 RepID=A0A4Q2V477_FUSOX|nr:hypothetical protein BFJ63_vAg18011 [Fusarium oxysporum f. sp. narcissi]